MNFMYEEAVGAIVAANSLLSVFTVPMSIVTYVFWSLGLYAIAKRRGIRKPWLSWIPVANVWILGSLSDQYRYVVRGEIKSKRKILLWLSAIMAVLYAVILVLGIVLVGNIIVGVVDRITEQQLLSQIVPSVLGMLGTCLPLVAPMPLCILWRCTMSIPPANQRTV